jgi:hypothetical protein
LREAPPAAVAFTWHPGQPAERASHVVVTFAAAPGSANPGETGTGEAGTGQTLVRLEHAGWEAFDDPVGARTEYERGWPVVIGRYQEQLGAGGETWVALLHRPGPAAPQNDLAGQLASLGRDTNSFGTKCSGLGRPRRAVSGTAPGG